MPVGLFATTLALFLVAIANLFYERNRNDLWRRLHGFPVHRLYGFRTPECQGAPGNEAGIGAIQSRRPAEISVGAGALLARPGCILVAVRDYNRMSHLHSVLEKTNLRRHDIVVMTVRGVSTGAGEYDLARKPTFHRLRARTLHTRGRNGGEGRQDRGPCRGACSESV